MERIEGEIRVIDGEKEEAHVVSTERLSDQPIEEVLKAVSETLRYGRHPIPTVDGVLVEDGRILLVKRGKEPYLGQWALPGGFLEYGESAETGVLREIKEETGIEAEIIELLGVFSDPERDPRFHTVTAVYVLRRLQGAPKGGDDAAEAAFHRLDALPTPLAFDHGDVVARYIESRG